MWLTMSNYSSRGYNILLWSSQALHTGGAHRHCTQAVHTRGVHRHCARVLHTGGAYRHCTQVVGAHG